MVEFKERNSTREERLVVELLTLAEKQLDELMEANRRVRDVLDRMDAIIATMLLRMRLAAARVQLDES